MSTFNGFFFMFIVCMGTHECHHASLEARGQLWTVSSLMPSLGSPDWNSGCLAWWQAPFPFELPDQPPWIYLFVCNDKRRFGKEAGYVSRLQFQHCGVQPILEKGAKDIYCKQENLMTNNTDQTRYPHVE